MTATILILVSAVVHAVVNVLTKGASDRLVMRMLIGVTSAAITLPFTPFVPLPDTALLMYLGMSFLIHLIYELALVAAYDRGDMAVVYPIARGLGPAGSAAGAMIFFQEAVATPTLIGVALVSLGCVALSAAGGAAHRPTLSALGFAVLTGATIACYTLVDAAAMRHADVGLTYVLWFFAAHACVTTLATLAFRRRRTLSLLRQQWRTGMIAGVLSVLTYGSALMAFRFGATTEMAALRETSVLFGAVLAVLVLREKMTPGRWAGAALITAGALAIKLI